MKLFRNCKWLLIILTCFLVVGCENISKRDIDNLVKAGKEVAKVAKEISAYLENQKVNDLEVATVERVVDGDTIEVKIDGEKYKVRLIGVDTPETKHPKKPVEPYGKEASEYTKKKLDGKKVYLEKDVSDTDRYGRLLRYVWLKKPDTDKKLTEEMLKGNFNLILVKEGYGKASTFPPDVKYADIIKEYQREAVKENKGLWSYEYHKKTLKE